VYLDALDGGQVAEVLARTGDAVSAGQPLIRFRNTALELDVLDREGRLVESITQVQTYEKDLEQTRAANEKAAQEIAYNIIRLSRAESRREPLLARGFIPRETTDQMQDELAYDERLAPIQAETNRRQETVRQAQLPQIAAEMATLRESLAVTRSKLDGLVLKAPVAGKLSEDELQAVGGDRRALVLPAGPFLERTGGDWVMVVAADGGHAERRRVKLGARNAEQVEVLAGLKPGERVITSDYAAFEKAARVVLTR